MLRAFFILIGLFFSFQIFYQKGHRKLLWFIIGILFFPNSIILINSPIILSLPRFLIYSLVFSLFLTPRWLKSFTGFPIRKSLIFILLTLLLTGAFDDRLDTVLKIYRPLTVFCENFFLLFVSFFYIKDLKETVQIYKTILWVLFFFGIFGLINYYQHENVYYLLLSKTYGSYDYSNVNMIGFIERFRISSFAWHAIYYGLLLSFGILLSIFFLLNICTQLRSKLVYYFLIILLLVNLVLVNSRTPILSLFCGFFIIFLWGFNRPQQLQTILFSILVFFSIMLFVPKAQKLLLASVETLSSQKQNYEDGSSLKMRLGQLQASFSLFMKHPIFGNGIYYIEESLGYSPEYTETQSDKALYGFESYLYLLLIERGLLGIVANTVFLFALIVFFIRNYKIDDQLSKPFSLLSISLLFVFLCFIVATGDMGSFTFFMVLMGINVKTVLLTAESQANNSHPIISEIEGI